MALLGSNSEAMQVQAVKALRNMACHHPGNKQAIAAAGAIPPLVALLGSNSEAVQQAAASALRKLSRNNAANQQAIAAEQAAASLEAVRLGGAA